MSPVFAVMLLAMVRAAPPARILAPSVIVSVPLPMGPAVTVLPTVIGALSAPKMREPAVRATPPVKVLAPVRMSDPLPVLLIEPPAPVLTPLRMRPFGESPLTLMVRAAAPKLRMLAMVGVVLKLSFTTVMPPVMVSPVPPVMVGAAIPPRPLMVMFPATVFAPE